MFDEEDMEDKKEEWMRKGPEMFMGPKMWWRGRIEAIQWAAFFIWGGLVLLAETTDFGYETFTWWNGWAVFLAGAGAIALLRTIIQLLIPGYRSFWEGSFIFGTILLVIGLGGLVGWDWIWSSALFIIAVLILRGAFRRRR